MIKTETQTIDGKSFTVVQFVAMRGFPIFMRFVKAVGPALAALQSADPNAQVASAIGTAFKDLDTDAMTALATDMLQGTTTSLNGEVMRLDNANTINAVFGGNLMLMFKVLAFSAKVNFGDFFDAALEFTPRAPQPSEPTTSRE